MGNVAVKKRYGIKVAAHPNVKSDFLRSRQQSAMFGMPLLGDSDLPDVDLEDGEIIKVGESTLEVISTPGHAMGSISLYAEIEGWVFTGDALFCRSIGRTDFPGSGCSICPTIRKCIPVTAKSRPSLMKESIICSFDEKGV